MVVDAFTHSAPEQKQVDIYEFKASLIYMSCSMLGQPGLHVRPRLVGEKSIKD